MSQSLRDQMLKAGLVTKKQVRQADRKSGQQQFEKSRGKKKRAGEEQADQIAQQAQAAKAARDRELNRKRQARAEEKARRAQLRQLVEQHRLPKIETDEHYNFTDGRKIRRVPVDAALRARILSGDLIVVRVEGTYELVPAAVAERIRAFDTSALIPLDTPRGDAEQDERYKDFEVPDDLIW